MSPLTRRSRNAVMLLVVAAPLLALGARKSVESMCVAPEQWAPASHASRLAYDRFMERFEGNDVVVVSWDGCTVDDERLGRLEAALTDKDDPALRRDFDRVTTGYGTLRRLTAPPLELSREEALARLAGTLVGPDGRTSCAVVVLTFAGNAHRADSIETILVTAQEVCGLDRDDLYVAGPPVDGMAIDRASREGIDVYGTLSTLVTVLLCRWFIRSWRLTGAVIGCALAAQLFVLALVPALGQRLDAILIVMPSLVFVLTVSAGVHLVNYFDARLREGHPAGAAAQSALSDGWKPCLVAAATTAIGIASLTGSDIAPVVTFGVVAALGVLFGVGVLLAVLPGAMQRWPLPITGQSESHAGWGRLSRMVGRAPLGITLAALVVMLLCGYGVLQMRTSVDVAALFPEQSRSLKNYRWIEKHIGPVVPIEVALDFGPDSAADFRGQFEIVRAVHREIRKTPDFSGVVSAATFAPEFDESGGFGAAVRERLQYRRFEKDQDELVREHYLHAAGGHRTWRISARVSALAGHDYERLLDHLKSRVAPHLHEASLTLQADASVTGIVPLIQTVQETILADLLKSFLTAFALVAAVMALVLRSLRAGLLAMLPNVFPILVVFGVMVWCGVPVDIGSVMTASVALGIAVDDTLHLVLWYRRELETAQSRRDAAEAALKHSGRAMVQTTLICGVGLLVFATADFVPTQRFGLLMAALLGTALLGDLVFLPSLLIGPLGRWFEAKHDRESSPTVPVPEAALLR